MNTFILAMMLTLTAVSGVVAAAQLAFAGPSASGVRGQSSLCVL